MSVTVANEDQAHATTLGAVAPWPVRLLDAQDRLIDVLEETGQLDNTIVVVVSDNGSSAEGGPNGTFNEWRFFNGVPDTTELTLPHIDELGTPASYNHYNTGWAWAFDTPFPYWKRFAGYEGGVADMCIVAWPARPPRPQPDPDTSTSTPSTSCRPSTSCSAWIRLGCSRATRRASSTGRASPPRLTDPKAPGRETQFYGMLGQRSIYHQGWLACTVHPPISGWGNFDKDVWQLYRLEQDRAQTRNLADEQPEQLQTLKDLWFYYAGIYKGAAARRPQPPTSTTRPR